MMDVFSDTYLESVQENEKDAFKTTYKPLTEVIAIIRGRQAAGLPMLTAQEEIVEQYLEEFAELFGWENAR